MNRRLYQLLVWLMWMALPLTALRFWLVWDQLPARMVTHFDINWQPNGWMAKELALEVTLGIAALTLLVFTVILIILQKQKITDAVSWSMLAFSYVMVGFLFVLNSRLISYNLNGQSANHSLFLLVPLLAALGLIAQYLRSARGQPLSTSGLVAKEVHSSPAIALAMIALIAFMFFRFAPARETNILFFLLIAVLLLTIAASAWSGFHYLFTRHGIEIRTLGFRLRSIPAEQIKHYDVGSWNILRGYGIRGVGNSRAYVWGNRGVKLTTAQGEVFLGHNDPDRVVRDLDMIRHNQQGNEDSRR
jgi:hypothetical protein